MMQRPWRVYRKVHRQGGVSSRGHVKRLIGRLIDAGIQYRQNFRKQFVIGMRDSFGATSSEVNGLNLLHHNETCEFTIFWQRDVKWETTICVCNRAYDGQPSASIE